MKLLGVDYGSKNVGVAISDDAGMIAFPRADFENNETLVPFLVRMIEQEKIQRVVVGDTLASNGRPNPITKDAQKFLDALSEATAVPVEFATEIWSSIEASRYAPKGEEHNNAAAAAIILQRYLDMHGNSVE